LSRQGQLEIVRSRSRGTGSRCAIVLSPDGAAEMSAGEKRNPPHRRPYRRFAAQSIVLAAILLLGFASVAQTPNDLSPAEIQGRELVSQILSIAPATNLIQTGTLKIHNPEGTTTVPIIFMTDVVQGGWRVNYQVRIPGNPSKLDSLVIVHHDSLPNGYFYSSVNAGTAIQSQMHSLSRTQIMSPFAGSDFWIGDLGLEFLHWPQQIVTGHETRRTRDCTVLESVNPNPEDGYSRVITWIDKETLGVIHAEAYDTNDKLLKIFDPKKIKKVNGQWELLEIEIQNVQTHSRTWIRFNSTSD